MLKVSAAEIRRILKFVAVGLVNTAVGLGVIYAATYFLAWRDVTANAMGYAVGLAVSFVLNARWTFHAGHADFATLARFLLCFAAAYGVNLAVLRFALDVAGLGSYLAQAGAVMSYTVVFYLISRSFVFRIR